MNNKGYLILQKPEEVIKRYERRISDGKFEEYYKRFRSAFSNFDPNKYRGISRQPLMGIPEDLQLAYGEILEPEAQFLIYNLQEQKLSDSDLIFNYEDVVKVFEKIKNNQIFEVILVRRETYDNKENILGFDIGYWGGDHFSLIADTLVIPTWHGPPEKDYIELAASLKLLNENLLFNSIEDAKLFNQYYKTKAWAETEDHDGEFSIIQIEKIF